MISALALLLSSGPALASSHAEAPGVAQTPAVDPTDFYMFKNPNDPTKVVFILNVNPMIPAGAGPNFASFQDGALYEIHIDNEGDGLEDIRYGFRFTSDYAMPDTFLYNVGDITNPANRNHMQTYIAARWTRGAPLSSPDRIFKTPGNPGRVAPANVGELSVPMGAYNPGGSTAGSLTTNHIYSATFAEGTYRFFAGPRQEGFYVDLERTFDLLNVAHTDNTNTLLGYNVMTIAIEVPLLSLTRDNRPPDPATNNHVIAAWATTSVPRTRIHEDDGLGDTWTGPYVQVGRLGNPLVNEAVIPVGMKDVFNHRPPNEDAQFLSYVCNPLLPVYMNLLLGTPNPGTVDAGLGLQPCREDLVQAFLMGLPGLNQPGGYALGGAIPGVPGKRYDAFDALRMNLSSAASGFPDGRAVGDDVVDVALSAMAGLLVDGTFVPDGVDATGLHYLNNFPFLGDPWSGDGHPQGFHPPAP
ncbi:MAG TPA: DUF4331 domain-containing protein [Myxococcota bacterium]|nr:DUF4331 domain-containing protein [Myxococcota bacterium]